MPMIDVYAAKETFGVKLALTKTLNQVLMRWEKVPLISWFLDNTAAFIPELEPDALANASGNNNCLRIQMLTPVGVLDRENKIGVTREMTDIVAAGRQRPLRPSPTTSMSQGASGI